MLCGLGLLIQRVCRRMDVDINNFRMQSVFHFQNWLLSLRTTSPCGADAPGDRGPQEAVPAHVRVRREHNPTEGVWGYPGQRRAVCVLQGQLVRPWRLCKSV